MSITKNNTSVVARLGGVCVILHNTEIFRVEPNPTGAGRRVTLNNGGFCTATTAKRINESLAEFKVPGKVSRAGGIMYYSNDLNGTGAKEFFDSGKFTFVTA